MICAILVARKNDILFLLTLICVFNTCFVYILGQVQNRFSKDMGQIDEGLPLTLFDFLQVKNDREHK